MADRVFHHVALDASDERPEVTEARELLAAKKPEEAVKLLEPVIQGDDVDYLVFQVLGIAYAQSGNMNAAVGAMESAARMNAAIPYTHYNLGMVLLKTGDLEGAREAFERSLRVDQTYVRAREALAAMNKAKPAG